MPWLTCGLTNRLNQNWHSLNESSKTRHWMLHSEKRKKISVWTGRPLTASCWIHLHLSLCKDWPYEMICAKMEEILNRSAERKEANTVSCNLGSREPFLNNRQKWKTWPDINHNNQNSIFKYTLVRYTAHMPAELSYINISCWILKQNCKIINVTLICTRKECNLVSSPASQFLLAIYIVYKLKHCLMLQASITIPPQRAMHVSHFVLSEEDWLPIMLARHSVV